MLFRSTAIAQYCKAKMFQSVGKSTPIAARFSTVGGERGSADTARDPRGFAVKFYTEEGTTKTRIFFRKMKRSISWHTSA